VEAEVFVPLAEVPVDRPLGGVDRLESLPWMIARAIR